MPRDEVSQVASQLASTDVCQDIAAEHLEVLAAAGSVRDFAQGEVLLTEGETVRTMMVVLRGEVLVEKRDEEGGWQHLATLGAGAMLGEGSLLEDRPRSATVRARAGGSCFEMEGAELDRLLEERHPAAIGLLLGLARALSRRHRVTNERLVDLVAEVGGEDQDSTDVERILQDIVVEWD